MTIEQEIKEIISQVLSVRHKFEEIDDNAPLTGVPLEIEAEELVYIVLELMDKFKITFSKADFENYKFNTVNGIIEAVKRHIN